MLRLSVILSLLCSLSYGEQAQSVLLVSPESHYVARAMRGLGLPHKRVRVRDLLQGACSPFDHEVVIFASGRGGLGRISASLRIFVEMGGVILGFRHDAADAWLPSPMSRDRAYRLGKRLQPKHPVFNTPHKFDEARLRKVHGGSIYRAFYDLGEGWTPLLSAGKQQGWDKAKALSAGPHYGIVEGRFAAGRIVLVQMIPAYAWFHDEKGNKGCDGALFFENLVRYALSKAMKLPGPRKPRSRPDEYADALGDLLQTPKGSDGFTLGDRAWAFTSSGPFTGKHDRRGVYTIGHPNAPAQAGSFGQIARAISLPKDGRRFLLRVYQSDDYCGGYEPQMVGDRCVKRTLNRREGFRFRQVLVDGKVVHEQDVLGRNLLPAVRRLQWFDVTELVRGKQSVEVALRVEDRESTGEEPFATDVFWACVDLRTDFVRVPARELAREGFEPHEHGVALSAGEGELKWQVAGIPTGDYVVAARLRDDPYGQSRLRVRVNGRALAEVTMSADDARFYWIGMRSTRLSERDTVVLSAEKDGREAVIAAELAVIPSALARKTAIGRTASATGQTRAVSGSRYYRPTAPAEREKVRLVVKETAGVERRGAFTSQAIPFAFGALPSEKHIAVTDARGAGVPIQVRPVTRWPDRSVQTAVVSFLADVPAHRESAYDLHFGSRVSPSATLKRKLTIVEDEAKVTIDSGPLRVAVPRRSGDIFSAVELDGKSILPSGAHWGIDVLTADGDAFTTDGETATALDLAERGPLRAIVVKKGQHKGSKGRLLSYRYEIHVTAGSRGVRFFYTLSNVENTSGEHLRRVTVKLPWQSRTHTTYLLAPANANKVAKREGESIETYQHLHDAASVRVAGAKAEERMSAQLLGWASAQGDASLHVAPRYYWQMYPKRMRLHKGVSIDLIPEPMSDADIPAEAKGPCEVKRRNIGGVGYPQANGKPGSFLLAIGESITHELWIEFSSDANAGQPAQFLAALNPLRAWPDAAYVAATKVFVEFHPEDRAVLPDYEPKVDSTYKSFMAKRERRKQYGMENFGDDTFEWGYGPAYTFWSNQEDDRTHGMLMQYVRSGDPRWWELGEQAARHYRDVDCVLAWPGREDQAGGPRHHSNRHFVSKGWVADHTHASCHPGHSWIEGLVDYWLLTGDLLAGEASVRMGQWYAQRVKMGSFGGGGQERGLGWTLTGLTTIYRATWDERYIRAAQEVQDWINRWQDPVRGVISVPISEQPSYEGGTTFMHGIVAHGVARLVDATGDPAATRSLQGLANWIVTEPMGKPGRFWYKQSPRCKRGYGYNGKAMTAMSHVYRMTGDPYMGYIANEIFTHIGAGIRSMPFLTPTTAHMAQLRKPVWLRVPRRSLRVAPGHPRDLTVYLRNVTQQALRATVTIRPTSPAITAIPARIVKEIAAGQDVQLKAAVSVNSKDVQGSLTVELEANGVRKRETAAVRAIARLVRIERTAKQGTVRRPVAVERDFATTPRTPDFPGKPRPRDGKTGGHIAWTVNVPAAGQYALEAEVYWVDDKGNSWYEAVDRGEERTLGNNPAYLRWHWVRGGIYDLSAGEHTIRIRTREDGARLRRIVLTNDIEE